MTLDKLKKIYNSLRYKNSKVGYYVKNICRYYTPSFFLKRKREKALASLSEYDQNYVWERVNYYNKLSAPWITPFAGVALRDLKLQWKKRRSEYFFDLYEYSRFFPGDLEIAYKFGGVTTLMPVPTIVKSRPVNGDNANSILLNMVKARHFVFIKDKIRFQDKKSMLIGRAALRQVSIVLPHRIKFWKMYFDHPLCDLGWTNPPKSGVPAERRRWIKPFLTIGEHLNFKFILALQGVDVATNLKWVMSSNSLAVMPRPTYETWFMEGRLIPNHHYVEIRPDYADLEERLNYYVDHPGESLQIIENAHSYVAQFQNQKQEDLISLLVLKKYFELTAAASPSEVW